MANGRWSSAAQHLNGLLAEHRGMDYAIARRSEIEECIRACAFWRSYSPPNPRRLISGKLLRYNESTGDICVTYDPSNTDDFIESRRAASDAGGEGSERGRTLIHPAVFDGPYTIALKGSRYPSLSSNLQPTILVDLLDDSGYSVIFGFKAETRGNEQRWLPAQIVRWQGEEYRELAKSSSAPCDPDKPYEFKVEVSGDEIAAFFEGNPLLEVEKEKGRWGRVGLREMPFDEIVIEGKIQAAWIQGLLDAAMHSARAEFDRSFSEENIPEWLRQELGSASARASKRPQNRREYPGPDLPGQEAFLSKAFGLYNDGMYRDGLRYTLRIPDGKVTEAAREFLLASFYLALDDLERALDSCSRVYRLDPGFQEARFMQGYLFAALGHDGRAIAVYRALLRDSPRDGRIHPELAKRLLRQGNPEEAKAVVDRAIREGLEDEELEKINRLLVKALHGPAWVKVFEAESKHYHVLSDIDQKTCREAAQILEEAYSAYTKYLQWIKDLERKKFRVYLFSGEAGYRAYLEGIDTDIAFQSAGLYIPSLKQLLIWNLPDREMMMRVVRHEGFHQYLDRLMAQPPLWFNEGLAEYYERAERVQGRWVFGQVHADHVRYLKESGALKAPLDDFLYMEGRDFQKNPAANYARSWAFIHFLRHSTRENSRLFESLFEELQSGMPAREALNRVFGEVDLDELKDEFEAYVRALG